MADTPKLVLPELSVSQASKEVTHNEALRILDAVVMPTVKDLDLTGPPGGEADGDTYIPAATATGAWAGHEDDIAYYKSSAWIFVTPAEGWQVYVQDEDTFYVFNGSAWLAAGDASGGSYDLGGGIGGKPSAGEEIFRLPMVRAVDFPDDLAGSRGSAGTTGTSTSSVFSIKKNGTQFATMTFAAGAATATFATGSAAESFAAGDVLTIVAPDPANSTLADVSFMLKGSKG